MFSYQLDVDLPGVEWYRLTPSRLNEYDPEHATHARYSSPAPKVIRVRVARSGFLGYPGGWVGNLRVISVPGGTLVRGTIRKNAAGMFLNGVFVFFAVAFILGGALGLFGILAGSAADVAGWLGITAIGVLFGLFAGLLLAHDARDARDLVPALRAQIIAAVTPQPSPPKRPGLFARLRGMWR